MKLAEWFADRPDLTQAAFAQTVGVTQGRIAQLLTGERPSMRLALRIADVTDKAVLPNDWIDHAPAGTAPAKAEAAQ